MAVSMRTSADVLETQLAKVAAGSATNDTFYYYLPIGHYRKCGLQFEWTAGGTGTVTVTVEGSAQAVANAATPMSPSTLTYHDITNAVYGVASWTDDFLAIDNAERLACCSYIRVKVVTLTTDANTAWELYARQAS